MYKYLRNNCNALQKNKKWLQFLIAFMLAIILILFGSYIRSPVLHNNFSEIHIVYADSNNSDDTPDAATPDDSKDDKNSDKDTSDIDFSKISKKANVKDFKSNANKHELLTHAGNMWSMLASSKAEFAGINPFSITTKVDKTSTQAAMLQTDKQSREHPFDDGDNKDESHYYDASAYGFILDKTGLDHSRMANGTADNLNSLGRLILGFVVLAGYGVNASVQFLFKVIVTLFSYVNVGEWITKGANSLPDNNPFKPVANVIYQVFHGVQDIGFIGILIGFALSMGLVVFGVRFSRYEQSQGMGRDILASIAHFAIKVFLIFSVPIMFATFISGLLSWTKGAYEEDNASLYPIYSNLVSFSDWSEKTRLALPSLSTKLPVTYAQTKVPIISHRDALKINAQGGNLGNARSLLNTIDSDASNGGVLIKKGSNTAYQGKDALTDSASKILTNWMTSSNYIASDWESYAKSYMSKAELKKSKKDNKAFQEDIMTDGDLTTNNKNVNASDRYYLNAHKPSTTRAPIGEYESGSAYGSGLSTIGMYNYLLTTFDGPQIKFTNAVDEANGQMTPVHSSVGLIGRGIPAMGNAALMIAEIWSMSFLGLMFAALAINAIIASIPKEFAYLLKAQISPIMGLIDLCMLALALLLQLVGGGLLLSISKDIIVGLSEMGDTIFTNDGVHIFSSINSSLIHNVQLAGAWSSTFYGVLNFCLALLLFYACIFLIKSRSTIFNVLGEIGEEWLRSFTTLFDRSQNNKANHLFSESNGAPAIITTDSSGNNRFADLMGDNGQTNSLNNSNTGGFAGSGTNYNQGAQYRSAALSNPKSPLGKAMTGAANVKDAIKAKAGREGVDPSKMSSAKKAMAGVNYIGGSMAASALSGAGAMLGNNALKNRAQDIRGLQQASIDDGLQKMHQNKSNKYNPNPNTNSNAQATNFKTNGVDFAAANGQPDDQPNSDIASDSIGKQGDLSAEDFAKMFDAENANNPDTSALNTSVDNPNSISDNQPNNLGDEVNTPDKSSLNIDNPNEVESSAMDIDNDGEQPVSETQKQNNNTVDGLSNVMQRAVESGASDLSQSSSAVNSAKAKQQLAADNLNKTISNPLSTKEQVQQAQSQLNDANNSYQQAHANAVHAFSAAPVKDYSFINSGSDLTNRDAINNLRNIKNAKVGVQSAADVIQTSNVDEISPDAISTYNQSKNNLNNVLQQASSDGFNVSQLESIDDVDQAYNSIITDGLNVANGKENE